jgi:hypothetical protein
VCNTSGVLAAIFPSFQIREFLTKYYSGVQIKKNEMGGASSMYDERRGAYRIFVGRPEGRNHLEDPGVDGTIILNWIFKKWDGGAWIVLMWLRIGTGGGLLRRR